MKRIASVLFVIVLCMTFASFAYADGASVSLSSTETAELGKTAIVSVVLADNPGFAYIKLSVAYDGSAFELASASDAGVLKGLTEPNIAKNPVSLTWGGAANQTANGTIATLVFNVKSDAAVGDKSFSVSVVECYDQVYDDVTVNTSSPCTVKVTIPAHDHTFGEPTYEWDGFTKCTATRACTVDGCTEKETEDATITSEVTKAAECGVDGETTYTATFTNTAFATQTKVDDTAPAALSHDWNDPTYVWAEDNTSCTATRTCKNDPEGKHTETVTVTATSETPSAVACLDTADTTFTATFSAPFTTQTKTVTGAVVPHNWGEAEYTWADDFSTVTAKHTCTRDTSHVETETGTISSEVKTVATCEDAGVTTYTATFTKTGFTTQTKDRTGYPEALGHDWGEVEYTWADDNSTVTAKRVCATDASHVETETVAATGTEKTAATCEAGSVTTWTSAAFTNTAFAVQTKDVTNDDALGHSWGTVEYTWADDLSTCTAKRVCTRDSSHVETETGTISSEVKTAATCEDAGVTTYTATFTKTGFTTQTKDRTGYPEALGHDWGEVEYTWADDNSTVTAKRVCATDASHVETETVAATGTEKTAATCEAGSVTTWTSAAFTNTAFAVQTKDVTNDDALGHSWGTVEYTWADDLSTCTAKRVCTRDSSHVETVTVNATSEVTTAATCTTAGVTTYTATFENAAFAAQSKTENKPDALGHDWGEPTWTWADDNSSATAKFVCANDETHVQTLTATISKETNAEPTCTEPGGEVITAKVTFTGKDYTDVKTVGDSIPALGHDWGEPEYKWAADYSTVTATRTCKTDSTHVEDVKLDDLKITSAVTKAAAVGTPGETTYTATFTVDGKKVTLTMVDKTKPAALEEIKLIEGHKGIAYVGSPYTFKSNAEYADFVDLYIDAAVVNRANYDVKEGSTVITLHADFVKTLKAGVHTVAIVSRTGSATGTFSVSLSPKTADTNPDLARLGLIVVLAAFGTYGIFTVARKRKTH